MRTFLLFVSALIFCTAASAQRPYVTSDGEFIFGFASINKNGTEDSAIPRFTMFFHAQWLAHFDQGENVGFFTGLSLRNVGFIYEENEANRKKFRTYNLGVPVGIKIGDMDNFYVFGGYELELPFNYKEKTFVNDEKVDKFNVWFSRRTPTFYHTLFAGIRFPRGMSLKFKYYMTPFFNKNYTLADGTQPYQSFEVNTFHISISSMITKRKKVVLGQRDHEL